MNWIKLLLVTLLLPIVINAKKVQPKFMYGISMEYVFDSNIGQNINETNAHYFVPKLNLKLKDFTSVPWFIKVNMVYDAYQQKRVPTLNSPLLNLGTGFNLERGKFSYNPEFSALLYVGTNVHIEGDPAGEMTSLVSVKRSLRLKNDFAIESKRNKLIVKNYLRYNDYGEVSGTSSEDELRVEVRPELTHKLKILKNDKIKMRSFGAALEYEGNFSKYAPESYNFLSFGLGMTVKLFRMYFNVSPLIAIKKFTTQVEHPQEDGNMIEPVNKYTYLESSLDIPIVSDLELKIGGKLRFKGSNNPSYDYDRHTFYARLKWDSSLGGK